MREETRNYVRNLLADYYAQQSIDMIWTGFKGLNNMTDVELEEELPKIGYYSIAEFEEVHSEELGLVISS